MAFLITVPTALAIFFAIFILVCIESVFKKLLRLFSLVIWICLVAMGYLFMCFGGTVSPWDQVRCPNAFCILICDIPGSVHLAPTCKQRLRRPSSEIAGPRGSAEWSPGAHFNPSDLPAVRGRPGSPCHLFPMAEAAFATRTPP